jgi:hypothetical protein
MLKRRGERGYLCVVLDLQGKFFSFLPLHMMLAIDFSYVSISCT